MCTNKTKFCNNENCVVCFEKSFACHDKAQYFSNENENEIDPRYIFKSSHKKYKFDCDCGHTFESSPNNISIGKWCPYCSNKKLCNNDDCVMCFEKSFASHEKAIYWSNENNSFPRNNFKSSNKEFKFDCNWCSYCSTPPRSLCLDENCELCFEKSFASNLKAQYWSKNNTTIPRKVFNSSNNKYFFDCECGHSFDISLSNINEGRWWTTLVIDV